MKTIYKYEIFDKYTFRLETPRDFKPLKVGIQNGCYYLWAEVLPRDNTDEYFERIFFCVTTGGNIPVGSLYIGSIVDDDMCWVGHYYWYPNRMGE